MTHRDYPRPLQLISRHYANVVATLALVIALTGTAAIASGVLVTSKTIRNGSILTQDIHKDAVKSSDIGTGAVASADLRDGSVGTADIGEGGVESGDIGTGQVNSADIGNGQVTAQDVSLPDPKQIQEGDVANGLFGPGYALLDSVGTYAKEDGASSLEIDWTGTVATGFSGCIFQLRADGAAAAPDAGTVYVANGQALSVSATALFAGLSTGQHSIELWAKSTLEGGPYPCTVGPAFAGIGQTFVVSEQVG
jgi:hypothetical protein